LRILIISELPIPSRRKSYRADPLSKYFPKMGHEITVVCPKSPFQSQKYLRDYENVTFSYIAPNERTTHNPLKRFFAFVAMAKKIRKELKEGKFDVIRPISFLPAYAAICANNKQKVPLVVNLSDFYSDLYKQFELPFTSAAVNILRNMEKTIARQSDVLIVDSPTQREYWKQWGLEENRCVVLPNGLNLELFSPKINVEKAKSHCGIDEKKVVFYHGDISHMDGIDVLVAAAPAIIKGADDVNIMVVGSGSRYANKLKSIVKAKGLEHFFIFTGWVPHTNIPQYIAAANVCVAPFRLTLTSNSNLMNKVIEYLAMRKPIVATGSSGLKEMLGDIANYIEPDDPKMLADVTLHVLNEHSFTARVPRMLKIAEKLDWKKIVQHEEKIINAMLNHKGQDFRMLDYRLT